MDLIFLIILFFILVLIIFIFTRIVWKATIWSSIILALWWSLIIILLVQATVPLSIKDNTNHIMGIIIIIAIVLILTTLYITDMAFRDIDPIAANTINRNVVFF